VDLDYKADDKTSFDAVSEKPQGMINMHSLSIKKHWIFAVAYCVLL
jgi:hypothetical protein